MAINKRKILDSAQKHLQKGALEKALKDYQTLLKADPKDSNVRLKIGDIQLKRGKTDDAISAYLKVAESFMQNGFDAKAVALYKQITKIDDKRVDVFVPLAELYERMGLQSDALKALQQAADVHYREGQKDQALDLLRRMAALDPSNTANRIKVADLLRQEDRNEEAVSEYEEVASELERQGAEEDRIRILVRVLELDPDRVDLMAAVGRSRIGSGNFEAAEKTARMMIDKRGEEPEGYELLGEAFDGLGRTEERVDAYRRAAELYRERGDDGVARDLTQRFVAPATLEDDIELDDLADDALLGDAGDELTGLDPEESDPGLDPKAMSIGNPIDDLEDLNDPTPATAPLPPLRDVAVADDDEAAAAGDPEQLLAEASVYLRYGKHDRAIESLQSIVARDPNHALAYSKLGEALAASGDTDQAMTIYEQGAAAALTGGDPSTFDMIKANLAAIDPARADGLSSTPSAGDSAPTPPPGAASLDADLDLDSPIDIDIDEQVVEQASVPVETSVDLPEVEIALDDAALGEVEESDRDDQIEFSIEGAAPDSVAEDVEIEFDVAEEDSVSADAPANELQAEVEIDLDVVAPESRSDEVPADFELSDPEFTPDDANLGFDDTELGLEAEAAPALAASDIEVSVDLGEPPELSLDDEIVADDALVQEELAPAEAASEEISLDDELLGSEESEDILVGSDPEPAPEVSPNDEVSDSPPASQGVDLLGSDEGVSVGGDLTDEDSFRDGLTGADDSEAIAPVAVSLSEDVATADELSSGNELGAAEAAPLADVDSPDEAILGDRTVDDGGLPPSPAGLEPLTDELDIAGGSLEAPPIPEAPASASATTPAQVAEDLEEADFFYQQGMLEEAREIYQRILSGAPSHPQALLRVGEIDVAVGGDADAASAVVATGVDPVEDLFDEAAAPVEASEATDLGAALEQALNEDSFETADSDQTIQIGPTEDTAEEADDSATPASRRPTLAEADVTGPVVMDAFSADGEDAEGEDAFDLAAQLSEVFDVEEPAAGSANLGLGSEDEGFEQVFAAFKQGVESALEDTDFEAHYDLGIAYREMGLVEDAVSEFAAAMGEPERKLASLHMMGLCALDLTRHADAVAHLEQALALSDVPADQQMAIRFDLGRAYAAQSDVERARAAFVAVQEFDPDFQDVASHLSGLEDIESGAAPAEVESEEAFENFDDLMAEDAETAPAEAQYESFDEFMDDEDGMDSGDADSADEPDQVATAAELEPGAEALEDAVTPEAADILEAAEDEFSSEVADAAEEAGPEAEPVDEVGSELGEEAEPADEAESVEAAEPAADADGTADKSQGEDAPPKKARRKKKISFV